MRTLSFSSTGACRLFTEAGAKAPTEFSNTITCRSTNESDKWTSALTGAVVECLPMSLLRVIQTDVANADSDLAAVVRKCKILNITGGGIGSLIGAAAQPHVWPWIQSILASF